MALFRPSASRWFYKSYKEKSVWNPARRWVYHKLFAVASVCAAGGLTFSYQRCGFGESHEGYFCGVWTMQFLELLPLGWISSYFGALAGSPAISRETHHEWIRWYVWWYGVDMSDVEGSIESFDTLESFFVRRLKQGARPLPDAVTQPSTVLTSPVDGIVLSVGDVAVGPASSKLLHIKGAQYTLQNLTRSTLPSLAPNHERKVIAMLMRAQDYHHVHAPCDLRVDESVVIPGNLLPTSLRGFRWIPNLFTTNERVCFRCEQQRQSTSGTTSDTTTGGASSRPLWMALIGGTLQGRIDVKFDSRIRTNLADPPQYAIHLPYSEKEKKMVAHGEDMARFRWGSAVVVVADVPSGSTWDVKPMDVVRTGSPILSLPPNSNNP